MSDRKASVAGRAGNGAPPTPRQLFACFARISLLSVGGGLSAWIRRSVVERNRWMDETQFLSGFALSQIAPGPSAVNLAVFVGATLGGRLGAAASLLGLTVAPFALIVVLGWAIGVHPLPAAASRALAGLGAGAIGLMIATGIRMGRRGLRGAVPLALAVATTAALAAGVKLLAVLAVALPLSLLLLGRP